MLCASTSALTHCPLTFDLVSGESPEEPVVSTKSGHVFERRLVEKYLAENNACPVTQEPLTLQDLLSIKGCCFSNASSFSQQNCRTTTTHRNLHPILTAFTWEWMGRNHVGVLHTEAAKFPAEARIITLFVSTRRCMSRSGASDKRTRCGPRVNAPSPTQLFSSALANFSTAQLQPEQHEQQMEVDGEGANKDHVHIPSATVEEFVNTSTALSQQRRKRKIPDSLCQQEQLAAFSEHHVISTPAIPVALSLSSPASRLAVSSASQILVVDSEEFTTLQALKSHSKRVHCVEMTVDGKGIYSGSADHSVKFHSTGEDGVFELGWTDKSHEADVTAVSIHPTPGSVAVIYLTLCLGFAWFLFWRWFGVILGVVGYLLSASKDCSWTLHSAEREGLGVVSVTQEEAITAARIHPDGLIYATGLSNGTVKLWDLKSCQVAFEVPEKFDHSTSSISFSENGYYVGLCGGHEFGVWDLRKLNRVWQWTADAAIHHVSFDHSGKYIGIASGAEIKFSYSLVHFIDKLDCSWPSNGKNLQQSPTPLRLWALLSAQMPRKYCQLGQIRLWSGFNK